MSNNINISSGSDFSKKIFGSIVKLTKPTFVHNSKVFSDHVFRNQQTLPLLENSIYYTNHGLSDIDEIYGLSQYYFNLDIEIQTVVSSFIQAFTNETNNPVATRSLRSSLNSISSSMYGSDPFNTSRPSYDDNTPPPDECRTP